MRIQQEAVSVRRGKEKSSEEYLSRDVWPWLLIAPET